MITIKIIYFGMIAEATEKQQEELKLPANSVDMLNIELQNKYPKMTIMNYQFAVNKNMVDKEFKLTDGDEVAVLPPFAGG